MNRILFFLFGSIYFRAQCGFFERFLNLCGVRGVKLYHLTEKDGILYAHTSLSSFRKIRKCAARSGVRIKILQKRGLPFIYAHFARRTGLAVGIALACFLTFFYTRSVWFIEIKGNETLSEQRIKEALYAGGIYEGIFKKDIHVKSLTFSLYEALPEVAWLNVGIDGSRLTVNLREATQKPVNRDEKAYCNIVAAKGGVVDKQRVYEGKSVVGEGYGVKEGQLLVSGVMYHESIKKNTFHCARADIYAFTADKVRFEIPKTYEKTVYTGREKQYKVLQLFRLKLPLYLFHTDFSRQEVSELSSPLILRGKQLPIVLKSYSVRETVREKRQADKATARALLRSKMRAYESRFRAGTEILKRTVTLSQKKESYVYTVDYRLYENIARVQPIETERKK